MSQCTTKPTKWHVRPAMTQIRVFDVRTNKAWVLSYPLSAQRSDQTRRMPSLILVSACRTGFIVGSVMRWLIVKRNIYEIPWCPSVIWLQCGCSVAIPLVLFSLVSFILWFCIMSLYRENFIFYQCKIKFYFTE